MKSEGRVTMDELSEALEAERGARQAAEEALVRRDELFALVSHDLRNPMNTINMSAALLAEELAGGGREAVARIQRSVARMERLLSDVIEFMRIDTGGLVLEPVSLSLRDLVEHLVSTAESRAAEKRLRLSLRECPPALRVAVDRTRILTALDAIVGNAIKFTPEGGSVEVSVRLGEGTARVVVQDTGPGIPAEELATVFERHRRLHKRRGGLALGLAIASGIVRLHGGRIGAESEVGRGSTFWIELPAGSERAT